ncbi:MAG TPA: peptidylprolyl isomerase [Luteolibacter sp.]|nr:peptidylprolyl isomerase [Luteolibacter sp.]
MTPLGRMSLRLAIYGGVVAWLACDLFVFHGPLRRKLDRADPRSAEAIAAAKAGGVVARVFNRQITRGQLERALHERLWLEGKTPADLTAGNLKLARYAALDELIDHELLRVKAKVNAPQLRVTDEEVNDRLRRMLARFVNKGEMERAMKSQGIANESELRERVAARIQQEKYVEMRIGPLSEVTDEEAREWFAEHADQLAMPERVRARHVFLSTLERPRDVAIAMLETALSELQAGSVDFASLAADLSEDPSSKPHTGDLGWMSRTRLPEDFAGPVFSMPMNQPSLVVTSIGVHIVEVTDRQAARPRTFEEAREEVFAALRTIKRDQAAREFRDALRRFESEKIEVFHDMLAE